MKPAQTMKEFFARADVKALQEVQKDNPFGSDKHREAFEQMKALAIAIGAGSFFGEYL